MRFEFPICRLATGRARGEHFGLQHGPVAAAQRDALRRASPPWLSGAGAPATVIC